MRQFLKVPELVGGDKDNSGIAALTQCCVSPQLWPGPSCPSPGARTPCPQPVGGDLPPTEHGGLCHEDGSPQQPAGESTHAFQGGSQWDPQVSLLCADIPMSFLPSQVAVKNNIDVFYFSTLYPLHILFVEDGKMGELERGRHPIQ